MHRVAERPCSKAYAESDGYELHVAVMGRNVLIARFHEERSTSRHGELAAEAGIPRASPSRRGARLLTPKGRTAIIEAATSSELVENGLLAVPTCAAQQVELIARGGMRQIELQVGIAAVDVLVAVQVGACGGIEKGVVRIEPAPAAVDAQPDGQRARRKETKPHTDVAAIVQIVAGRSRSRGKSPLDGEMNRAVHELRRLPPGLPHIYRLCRKRRSGGCGVTGGRRAGAHRVAATAPTGRKSPPIIVAVHRITRLRQVLAR